MGFEDLKFIPVIDSTMPMNGEKAREFSTQLKNWQIIEDDNISILHKVIGCDEFSRISQFIEEIIQLIKNIEDDSIDITFGKQYVIISIFNKTIGGLHVNDFVLAAKIDQLEDRIFYDMAIDKGAPSENNNG